MALFGKRGSRENESLEVTPASPPHSYTTPAVRAAADWSWQFLVIVIASGVVLAGLIRIKVVVVPVLVAVLVTALLMPVARFVNQRLHVHRTLAVIVALLLGLGGAGGMLFVVIQRLIDEVPALATRAEEGVSQFIAWLGETPLNLDQAAINRYWDSVLQQLQQNSQTIVSGAVSVTASVGQILAGALIVIFCVFFFLRDGERIWHWVVGLFPLRARHRINGAGERSWLSLGSYVRTQILVAFVDAIGIGVGAWILGLPLAMPIGVLVFLGAFIPIVGAFVTGTVAVAVALVDQGPVQALIMFAIVLGVQQLEGNLLQPLLMGRALKLHPVAVLLAVTAGTVLAGIIGALIAVPVIAVLNTAVKYLVSGEEPPGFSTERDEHFGSGPSSASADSGTESEDEEDFVPVPDPDPSMEGYEDSLAETHKDAQ